MTSASAVRRILSPAAVAAAIVLASCAEKAPPPPPPPPPPPAVSLSPKLVQDASAFEAYIARTAAISPAFGSPADVAQSLRTGAAYQPDQLLRGAIAYGAVAALQDPAFVAGVRTYVVNPEQRQQIAQQIMANPYYATGMAGAASAAGLVETAIGDDGRKLILQGRLVKQAAYDVQRTSPWSKTEVAGRDARLALAKQLATAQLTGDVAETSRLQEATTGGAQLGIAPESVNPPYPPVVTRALAVAALAALGYGDDVSLGQIMPLTGEPNTTTCLNETKLNLYQCLAVAKPNYEDIFCLGQHGMMDTGSCLMKAVGVAEPPLPPPPPPPPELVKAEKGKHAHHAVGRKKH